MVRLGERGVSDIVVIAFMFIFLVSSAVFLLGFTPSGLEAAADRQTELKVDHLHRTLERAEVQPGITALDAAARQIIIEGPMIDNNYLESWMENTLNFLKPVNYGTKLKLTHEDKTWEITQPENATWGENILRKSTVTIIRTGGNVASANAQIWLFKITD